jgi:hypothetical protein
VNGDERLDLLDGIPDAYWNLVIHLTVCVGIQGNDRSSAQ